MKLTLDYIKEQVDAVDYAYNGTFTVCTITTWAGVKLAGTSGCLDPKNYDRAIGEKVAYDNALSQIWALEGYFFAKLGVADEDVDLDAVAVYGNGRGNGMDVVLRRYY